MNNQTYETIAAVDLGSNSFRLQVARVVDDQVYPLDSLKEMVRLAAGLTADKQLDMPTQTRALNCLKRFNERLRGLPKEAVRVVGTNTLRVAKKSAHFLKQAEEVLGFPIEIISGREEARLIYIGVAHSLPKNNAPRLVVDIGGGSTEFIIGQGIVPQYLESLNMGCISHTLQFFKDGYITEMALSQAEWAARIRLQDILNEFGSRRWEMAIGSSGTARSLAEILQQHGWSDGVITRQGLHRLRQLLLKIGQINKLQLPGLRPERAAILIGGFSIMNAVFAELNIEQMQVANTALREGVLYDLVGRFHDHDMRDVTVNHFMKRYQIDVKQAERVVTLATTLYQKLSSSFSKYFTDHALQQIIWAARLHELGISVAHGGYHKHGAYIIANADMPGFSRSEQAVLSRLIIGHRGSLDKLAKSSAGLQQTYEWAMFLVLRFAVLFGRSRREIILPDFTFEWREGYFRLALPNQWLEENPLTQAALNEEAARWQEIGMPIFVGTKA